MSGGVNSGTVYNMRGGRGGYYPSRGGGRGGRGEPVGWDSVHTTRMFRAMRHTLVTVHSCSSGVALVA